MKYVLFRCYFVFYVYCKNCSSIIMWMVIRPEGDVKLSRKNWNYYTIKKYKLVGCLTDYCSLKLKCVTWDLWFNRNVTEKYRI